MNDRLLKFLKGKSEFYPYFLEERFPRVFYKILELCETQFLEAYLLDLMVDNRGGTRQGFPHEAAAEIIGLGKYLDSLQAKGSGKNVWDNVPELKRAEVERLGYFFTPQGFLKAIDNNNIDAVHVFLSCGVDLEVKDERSWTPLMIAAANGNKQLTRLLIHCGAVLMACDINGFTPLHWASFNGMSDAVELLISKGAEVNFKSKFGWTPLMQACTRGHLPVCSILVASGANESLSNSDGSTAIQIAKSKGFIEIVQLLSNKGEDLNSKSNDGNTSLKLSN